MEGDSGNDHTVDDPPVTPRPSKIPRLRSDGTEQAVDESMEADDRDDIVKEISVFCASGILGEDTQLYVMQHVLREAWRPYELNKRCEELVISFQVRLNPKQLKIEVDLRMERDDENYDKRKSKPLKLQKQTLSSSVVSSGIQYAVGFLEEKKEKVASKNSDESKIDDVPWVLLQYHPMDSTISNKNKHKMATEVDGNAQFMMGPSDYLHFLSSGNLVDETVSVATSMRVLHRMPLEERLKKWFCEVNHILISLGMMFICIDRNQVNSFVALKYLAYGYSDDDLLKVLPSYANLVQGLWVCKSSLLYSGADAIQRDYILLQFNRMNTIQYHKLKMINLNPSVFKCMMDALAYDRKVLGDWKFKRSADLSFIKSYPNIVQEQENTWLGYEKIILDSIQKVGKKSWASLASDIVKTTTAHKADSPFTNRDRDVIESLDGQSMSSGTREHLPRALLEIFNDKKVCSLQSIVRGLREMALYKSSRPKEDPKTRLLVNAAANAVSAPGKELCSVIDQIAVCIHGVYVLKSAGNPALDPFRNVVINLYRGKEPNAKLKKQEINQAAQLSLKRDISDYEYNQVIHELCISRRGKWELKSGE